MGAMGRLRDMREFEPRRRCAVTLHLFDPPRLRAALGIGRAAW